MTSGRHEETDVNIRAIFKFAVWLAAVAAATLVVVRLLFVYFDRREQSATPSAFPIAVGHEMRLPPEPRLQTAPRIEMEQLRNRQEQRLNGYEWVDKSSGVVRIPIDEAIKLTLQKGLPSRGGSEGQPK
jgi:hypothetical protein